MASTDATELAPPHGSAQRRLFVAWQNPTSRTIRPVGALSRLGDGTYEFRYLPRAASVPGFRPFVAFPSFHRVYRTGELFPFFQNRLVSRDRSDFPAFVATVDLDVDADPFEILARTQGRRATDTVEVFPEPIRDSASGTVTSRFLVRGIRHIPGAQDAIDALHPGDALRVLPDPDNPVDRLAVVLRTDDYRIVGWVPAYLTEMVHAALARNESPRISVERIGRRDGPVHLRLLCRMDVPWPANEPVLTAPEFGFPDLPSSAVAEG